MPKNARFRKIEHPEIKKILVYPDNEQLARAAAEFLTGLVSRNTTAVVSYATGNSPVLFYQKVGQLVAEGKADFSQTKAFHLDEYYPCGPEKEYSFVNYLNRLVFKPFRIRSENTFPLNGLAPDPDKEADRYERLLKKYPVDLSILGIGPGGHIAFDEPGTPFDSLTHVVKLSKETIKRDREERGQDSPGQALTQGIGTILRSKKILQVAQGSGKYTERFKLALWGPIEPACPSSVLRTVGERVTIMIDEVVAKGLRGN
ncbi:MAG: glucosamine-6-phosphate deaminase [Candidatus Pacebacteria bacterium]|nr:glucosamine-6-phosphate deaminase [Candidatus Paceibacterota bacterium]